MEYYHDIVTQKSWKELQNLQKTLKFVLIGGWATYLYTKALKSKDIDIILDFDQLSNLEKQYQVIKNERLNKYEAIKDQVEIDVYLPYYSKLGIPVEDLLQHAEHVEGFRVLHSHYLTVLKIYTLQQRGRSSKGRKDFIDIISLIHSGILDWKNVQDIVSRYKLTQSLHNFKVFLQEQFEIPELNLNKHGFSKIKAEILRL